MSQNDKKPPQLSDEEKKMVDEVLAWWMDDEDKHPYEWPERLTDEKADLVKDFRDIFNKEIFPLLERIKDICEEHDIPMFATFVTEVTDKGQMGFQQCMILPFKVCELIAIYAMMDRPHDFIHDVIRNAQLHAFLHDQMDIGDEDNE